MITPYKPLEVGHLVASQDYFSTWIQSKWTLIALALFFLLLLAFHIYSKNNHPKKALLERETKDPAS